MDILDRVEVKLTALELTNAYIYGYTYDSSTGEFDRSGILDYVGETIKFEVKKGQSFVATIRALQENGKAKFEYNSVKVHYDATEIEGYDSQKTSTVLVIIGAIAIIIIILLSVLCCLCRRKGSKEGSNAKSKQFPNIHGQEEDFKGKNPRSGAYAEQNLDKSDLDSPYNATQLDFQKSPVKKDGARI